MRWDALFGDLEAQIAAAELLAAESEISERVRLEQSAVALQDRLRGQMGYTLKVRTAGGSVFAGALSQVGAEWLVLDAGPIAVMIPAHSVQTVEGMGRRSDGERSVAKRRLGLGSVFRAFARDRTPLTVAIPTGGLRLDGTIDRVGRDFIELASVPSGEQRRSGSVSGVLAIPFAGVAAVISRS